MPIVHETAPAAYGWATVRNAISNPQFDVVRADATKAHTPVEGWNQRDFAVALFKAAGLDFEAEKARARTEAFTPVAMKGEAFSADYDHFALAQMGVPAITILEGQDFVVGGREAGKAAHAAYFTQHYHQPSDKWRPDFNYDGALRDLDVYYALGRDLADSRDWPGWEANSQFKPARDATAAERQ